MSDSGLGGGLDYDVLVVGSGFGGSVTALRLTEKGYRVGVLESGRRFTPETLPKTSWDLRSFLWAPRLGCYGIQRINLLNDVVVLSGAGVGGGSLVYANTLYEPLDAFFSDPQWQHITDWRDELAPFYDQAKRMLGVTENPTMTAADEAMLSVAEDMGVGHTFHRTPVGVFFGEPGRTVEDPYFGGAGPARTGCTECGNCMIGCRVGAKNRLDVTYLYLAERGGAVVHPETTVTSVAPRPQGGYTVRTAPSRRWRRGGDGARTFTAGQVVFAAGALGTQRLLHALRDEGVLPNLSTRLGELTRTNSEALLGAMARTRDIDYSHGVAITSSFHPDPSTHIEPVRYGPGSNAMGLLATVLTDGGPGGPRWWKWLQAVARHPRDFLRSLIPRGWSQRTIIALVMQSLDNSLTVTRKRGLFGPRLTSRQGHGDPNPTWIPVGNDAVRRLAAKIGGAPGGAWGDLANVPMTAHIIGGCVIGDSADAGVIDPFHRVYGYPGLHVVDGSAVSANLGVNPSLTITALAERAMAFWPNRAEPDPRPPLGAPYRRVSPVQPVAPIVPAHAPAALRLTPAPAAERPA
ncbi:MAG TPA: GMC family oxidoreductase [Mycobacteriales bacterium]|nr:GMC family oxidoreductase [Mycobacteriales bacterium]